MKILKDNIFSFLAGLILIILFPARAMANDPFYELNTIQKIEIFFARSDWDFALDSLKTGSGGYYKADSIIINGTKLANVGVKYKGNSSYDSTHVKNPFNIALDQYQSQTYQGFKTIKMANIYQDPSMIREVLAYYILGHYMHAPQANFIKVYVNGKYIGLYSNTEAVNKSFCSNHFNSSSNTFFECSPLIVPGPTNKSSLRYLSDDSTAYADLYELKSTTGWKEFVALCDTVSNHTERIGSVMDMDKVMWMLAFDNVLVNLDSYMGLFSQNWLIYKDNTGRFDPIIWDLNMSFGGFPYAGSGAAGLGTLSVANMKTLTPALHSTDSNWPLIKAVMNNATFRKIYFAHMRTIVNEFFANKAYVTVAQMLQALVDSAVQEDTNKFFSYSDFQNGLTSDISLGSYLAPGISNLMDARVAYLQSNGEFSATPPNITAINPATTSPVLNDSVVFTATVQNATAVNLGFRVSDAPFTTYAMYDDGNHNDGAANDGVYGVKVKVGGLSMQYYAYAENASASAFLPARAEFEFYSLIAVSTGTPQKGDLVINEFLASNVTGVTNPSGLYSDWIELYNPTDIALNLYGLYISDNYNKPTKSAFPANTIIQPKSYLTIWADDETAVGTEVHAAFSLSKSGEEIMISDVSGNVLDSIKFGVQLNDVSMGRCPDGTGIFMAMKPTFGTSNVCITGIQQISQNQMSVYPNPANDNLTISNCAENVPITIYNIFGEVIFKQVKPAKQLNFSVSDWSTGIYIIRQNNDIRKFIIQH
jgi:hypothetical protein